MKKFLTLLLSVSAILNMMVISFAQNTDEITKEAPDYFTQEYQEKVKEHDNKVNEFLNKNLPLRSGASRKLTVPLYMQEKTYSCGAASTRMILKYFNYNYSEATLRSSDYLNTDNDMQTIVYKITNVLNKILPNDKQYMHKKI